MNPGHVVSLFLQQMEPKCFKRVKSPFNRARDYGFVERFIRNQVTTEELQKLTKTHPLNHITPPVHLQTAVKCVLASKTVKILCFLSISLLEVMGSTTVKTNSAVINHISALTQQTSLYGARVDQWKKRRRGL